jgi:GTPase SAR1 family protein
MLYANADGVVLVHDLTNPLTYSHLWGWLEEVNRSDVFSRSNRRDSVSMADKQVDIVTATAGLPVPVLLVGTKLDMATSSSLHGRRYSLAEEFSCESLLVCCVSNVHFATHSPLSGAFDAFFEKAVQAKFKQPSVQQQPNRLRESDSIWTNQRPKTPRMASDEWTAHFSQGGA